MAEPAPLPWWKSFLTVGAGTGGRMRILLAIALSTALAAQGSAQGSGERYNCTTAFTRRAPNVALGFAITWGGARATRSVKVGAGLSVAAGLYKAVRDSRDGNDRASVGTNLTLHVAGTMIGAALAKRQLEPEFAAASKALP